MELLNVEKAKDDDKYKYIISYDLKEITGKKRDYNTVKEVLENLGAKPRMQSFWVVHRPESKASRVRDLLFANLNKSSFNLVEGDQFWIVQAGKMARIPPVRKAGKR